MGPVFIGWTSSRSYAPVHLQVHLARVAPLAPADGHWDLATGVALADAEFKNSSSPLCEQFQLRLNTLSSRNSPSTVSTTLQVTLSPLDQTLLLPPTHLPLQTLICGGI